MKFLKIRFRALVCLCIATAVCLTSVSAVSPRMVGDDTKITFNGVTYTHRAHINQSSKGVYGGASVKSSTALQAGIMTIAAFVFDEWGTPVLESDFVHNSNNTSTISVSTGYITKPGVYFGGAILGVYNPLTGGYDYGSSEITGSIEIPAAAALSEETPSPVDNDAEWILAEKAKMAQEQAAIDAAIEEMAKEVRERSAELKGDTEWILAEKAKMAQEQAAIDAAIEEMAKEVRGRSAKLRGNTN